MDRKRDNRSCNLEIESGCGWCSLRTAGRRHTSLSLIHPGKVGHFERVLPRGLGDDVPRPHYHLYGIAEIVPNKLIALEVLPEQGGSYGNTREWMSFDTILLTELESGRTKLTFMMIDVHMGKGEPDFHQRRREELEEVAGRLLAGYFDNLKQLVAGCG